MKNPDAKHTEKQLSFFALALRHMLYRTGHKQAEICTLLGRKSSYVSQISNGRRGTHMDTWIRIADFFGLTIEQFVHLARLLNEGIDAEIAYRTATNQQDENVSSQIDGIFETIRKYWIREMGTSAESILALSKRFPEIAEWAERQIIIKNPAECGA